ncbi:hypothetical protein H4F38_04845 [Pectobacterium brasiliense]|uniref:hypothetical protein n=1 Tax=Pectobacterium TaxID=122277 RepID=UPI00057C787A|nr:hypothetical protein [Pectobacterium brasiliense]APS31213.1 hypothetical protein NC16_16485 [Pectobacterium brasiliense]KHS97641.1 hypothetical protein RC91_19690 [Pectobacterium brasiliense]MBN3097086.1 hypothetical protein [Pectobacterium brasiliense]MBN3102257.1 hypothetical protein [Pectobacterium brasiliense]MBN3165288.1 hypothetical protein [Pectobacterium brasiliense]
MNKRALILKSGLSVRELLRLKNNYVDTKSKVYSKETKIKDIEPFSDYILFVSRLSWRGMLIPFLLPLCFAIYDYYEYRIIINSIKFFMLIYGIMLLCVFKSKGDYFKVKMITIAKLMYLRIRDVLNYQKNI